MCVSIGNNKKGQTIHQFVKNDTFKVKVWKVVKILQENKVVELCRTEVWRMR